MNYFLSELVDPDPDQTPDPDDVASDLGLNGLLSGSNRPDTPKMKNGLVHH